MYVEDLAEERDRLKGERDRYKAEAERFQLALAERRTRIKIALQTIVEHATRAGLEAGNLLDYLEGFEAKPDEGVSHVG
ncbi:MAG TPA: hypothetical protein VD994_05350 [Prosthecobacter sp.]|nr:hypothetical protein [Prosthecobacter sp.]